MPRTAAAPALPGLESSLYALNVEELKWYAGVLGGALPTRKGDLVGLIARALTDADELRRLWGRLAPAQQHVVSEVVYSLGGVYNSDLLEARCPGCPAPRSSRGGYSFFYSSAKKAPAAPFDLFFFYNYDVGRYMPPDLAARLRPLIPPPPPIELQSSDATPEVKAAARKGAPAPELLLAETERAVFHDLGATLYLAQQGKAAVSPATRLPTLPTLRLLRPTLLLGDYFPDEYERAEDAVRPLALMVLVQAAKWAAPTAAGNKLELTRAGQGLIGAPLGADQVREAWARWLKSDILDELSRVRNIKGQQAKGVRLTKPAERREKLAAALRALPVGRWVTMDELLRHMRAEGMLPAIERNSPTRLGVGTYSSGYYDESESYNGKYWDVITGSYLRAALWEYAATLGVVELAYTRPEQSPHDFGRLYYLDDDYLSRYDGLVALRLTSLGAYALGLTDEYAPPPAAEPSGAPAIRVLPNLDVVITDAASFAPTDRALLERIAAPQSQDVYRLNREQILEAAGSGLDIAQIRQFLAARSGQAEAELPQIVRVFFEDLEKRLNALREGGPMIMFESDDPFILTELSNNPALRGLVRLATVGDQTVLLAPEEQAAAVRRQLKKLGYVPRRG